MRYKQKRTRKSSKRAQLWIFTPHFSKFRAFRTLHSPKQHVFLEFLVKNNAFHFSKRALREDTARNKLLKKPWHPSPPWTTSATEMKLWTGEQNFLRVIFKSNPHSYVTSAHVQMIHFETWWDFTGQLLHFKTTLYFFRVETW